MVPRLEISPDKCLVGKSMRMSLVYNKTAELWQSFMTDRKSIRNPVGTNLYSIQVYDGINYYDNFDPHNEFTKWAAIEVEDQENIPNGFMEFTLEGGLYAVFLHKGPASEFRKTFEFIFSQWLPKSDYVLDHRPHFELLGLKYKNNHPNSEEEIWIPLKKKV